MEKGIKKTYLKKTTIKTLKTSIVKLTCLDFSRKYVFQYKNTKCKEK